MKTMISLLTAAFLAGTLLGATAYSTWYEWTVGQRLKWYETTCRSPI